jgi:hypothetical protein
LTEFNYPEQTAIKRSGDKLYFSGSARAHFNSDIIEVYGIEFN